MRLIPWFEALVGGGALTALGLALAVATEGCSSTADADTTTGKRVRLHTEVRVDDAAREKFTSGLSWDVTLDHAAIAAGPFYYFDGVPPLVLSSEPTRWRYAALLLGLRTAQAHPGHYQAGKAMGEMLEVSSLDLLGKPAQFPDGDGVTGSYRSARFSFAEPQGPAKARLDGHSVIAIGKAEKSGEPTHYFRAFADLAEIEKHASHGQVDGCELKTVNVKGDGTITATVDARIWFDWVDFATTDAGTADAPADLPSDSDARTAFELGVTQLSAYKFSFSDD